MNTGSEEEKTFGSINSAKKYLSPESFKELKEETKKIGDFLKTFEHPPLVALAAMTIASLISQATVDGIVMMEEQEKFVELIVMAHKTSHKLANEATANFLAEKLTGSSQAIEA